MIGGKLATWLVVSLFLFTIGSLATGQTIYVDAGVSGGGGTSWSDAYKYLADALAAASSDDEVRIAQGIYKPDQGAGITPGDRTATFQLSNGVTIRGGYAGYVEADPDARDISLYETILSGDLTGNDDGFIYNGENSYHVVTASGTDGTAVLDGVTIIAGNADGSAPDSNGGGIYASSSSATLTNCTFRTNSANGAGGGIYDCDGQIVNCLVRDNRSTTSSGAAFSNCDGSIVNCTITYNMAASGAGGLSGCSGTIANCIIWPNIPNEIYNCSQPSYSCIRNWSGGGTGNISTDPLYEPAAGDYHLQDISPCINTGDNTAIPAGVTTDLDGKPRIIDGIVDMGVYEYGDATPPYQKNQVVWPDDPFCMPGASEGDSGFVKFTILLDDPCMVIFNDSQEYPFHYDFAVNWLDAFIGMTLQEYYNAVLYEEGQLASIGAVIMPPISGVPPAAEFAEYGIQFVRQDPYTKEQIRDMFNVVKANVIADPCVEAFYFPSYEQQAVAQANIQWFAEQGIIVSSTARWVEGNIGYSYGWAMGRLKYVAGTEIQTAYTNGDLLPTDILLSDGIPMEIPFVAGVLSLSPVTPSSHVVILARTNLVPVVHLSIAEDVNQVQQLIGRTVFISARDVSGICEFTLMDVNDTLTAQQINEILELKKPPPLDISPLASCGVYSTDTNDLLPTDVNHFGGKSSNFGILRTSIPNDSPVAVGFSFDVWNEFLDQSITPRSGVTIDPYGYVLFWADEEDEGSTHADFKLSKSGEDIALFDIDGATLIDSISFGTQTQDISYGRWPDGNDNWVFFSGGDITPGTSNAASSSPNEGLFINEFMADNDSIVQDQASDYDDWLEIYNAGPQAIDIGGMYLTDDLNSPTNWMIQFDITGSTLRQEIANRLSNYPTYPPSNMAALSVDLHKIRSMFRDLDITGFSQQIQDAVIATLADPQYGFDPNVMLRFRSSTNVEDSGDFTGAGLYDSYSGCLADDLDGDDLGPCNCDPCETGERGVFRAIRKVLASFYNDNAFLERLRYDVNEAEVGMAILAHHSFPDELELANGVAIVEKKTDSPSWYISLVSQTGSTSVTNPPGGSTPEEVDIVYTSPGDIELTLVKESSLLGPGFKVMGWPNDYEDLSELLVTVANRFSVVTGKTDYLLDLEYKKMAPGGMVKPQGGLVVKQVRQVPQASETPSVIPVLINEPAEYSIFTGEFRWGDLTEDVFANHRLKCKLILETEFYWLEPNDLNSTSFYADANMEYLDNTTIYTKNGLLPTWPAAYHSFEGNDTNDGWRFDHLSNPRAYELRSENIPGPVTAIESPLFTLSDLGSQPFTLEEKRFRVLTLQVDYNNPVLSWDLQTDSISTTTTDLVRLWQCPQPSGDDVFETRTLTGGTENVTITTSYYHPPPPEDCGWNCHTAPLARFVETTIEGYTTVPIVLHGYYSQTYNPEHHNIKEHFLFEPQLEPEISQNILDELQAKDIRFIHLIIDNFGSIKGDLDGSHHVNFADFAKFAARWMDIGCNNPGWCNGADLTRDGNVDIEDLLEFTENWLKSAIMTYGFED